MRWKNSFFMDRMKRSTSAIEPFLPTAPKRGLMSRFSHQSR